MPLRDYRCKKCGTTAEHLVRASDPAPNCDAQQSDQPCDGELEPVEGIARTSFALKGSGWFKTGGY